MAEEEKQNQPEQKTEQNQENNAEDKRAGGAKAEEVKEEAPKEETSKEEAPQAETKPDEKEEAKQAEGASVKKRKKINKMSLDEAEKKLKEVEEKMGGLDSRYARELLKRKSQLSAD